MANHPRWILGRYDRVEMIEVEFGKCTIRIDEIAKRMLTRRDLDQVCVMRSALVDRLEQPERGAL